MVRGAVHGRLLRPGPERDAFLASVPGVLRLLHRLVRPRYDRLLETAFRPTTSLNLCEPH